MFWLDSGDSLTHHERLRSLAEYRMTGGMLDVVMELPSDDSPEERDRVSGSGPDVDQIDWSGFPIPE